MSLDGEKTGWKKWMLLCEGRTDMVILEKIIEKCSLQGKFSVRFPLQDPTKGLPGGRPGFKGYLEGLALQQNFVDGVKGILVLSDSDTDPANSFNEIKTAVAAAGYLSVPSNERVLARTKGKKDVVVMLIPKSDAGNLETLCVEAAYSKWTHIKEPLDAYVAATGATNWTKNRQSKMRLQCIIAATCEKNPSCSLGYLWGQKDEYHIPLDHDAFKDISTFLTGFEAMLGGS